MIVATVSFNTSRRSGALDAYTLSLDSDPSETEARPLAQDGAVWNNRISYRGVFRSEADAARAILDYVGRNCAVVEVLEQHGFPTGRYSLRPTGSRGHRVLASRSAAGLFVAE